jgi:hypothetical protein
MKLVLAPLAALVLTISGWSFQHSTPPPPLAQRQAQTRAEADALYRHRACQPHHWRGMMLRR